MKTKLFQISLLNFLPVISHIHTISILIVNSQSSFLGFLSKTIDTPEIELPPLGDEEEDELGNDADGDGGDISPNNDRKIIE